MRKHGTILTIALLLILLAGLSVHGHSASEPLSLHADVLDGMPIAGWVDTASWQHYEHPAYGFRIGVPPDLVAAESPDVLVVSSAVVTFVPATDPGTDRLGNRTNLLRYSVTIGVTEADDPAARCGVSDDPRTWDCEPDRSYARPQGYTRDAVSEGAAGNRYTTLRYRMVCGATCYEIALFVHAANPGCYAPGVIVPFDPTGILHTFGSMLGTFTCLPGPAGPSHCQHNLVIGKRFSEPFPLGVSE